MRVLSKKRILVGLVACVAPLPSAAQAPPPREEQTLSPRVREAMRELWTPAEPRALRSWSVRALGAERLAEVPDVQEDIAIRGWSDTVDLGAAAGNKGTAASPRFAVATAAWNEPQERSAVLTFGSSGSARVWLNDRLLGVSNASPGSLFPVGISVPLRLRRGANRLVVELENRGEPWRVSALLLHSAAAVPLPAQLIGSVLLDEGALIVTPRTGVPRPATIAIVTPGGQIAAVRTLANEAAARFDHRALPDGPYELVLRARGEDGSELLSRHVWLKGNMGRLERVIGDGAAGGSPDAGRWRLLARLLTATSEAADPAETRAAIFMEAAELSVGHQSGLVRLAWRDETDDSDQYCRAYLPTGYDPARAWPAIVRLHGFNPVNPPYHGSWGVTERYNAASERYGVVWIEPHARGNTQYLGIGERDVLRCLAEARRTLNLDGTRTYLIGESMGGSGTWLLGARHPDLFAAIAPTFGGWDFRLHPQMPFANSAADRPMERWVAEIQSSFASAEQLLNTPVFVRHGDADMAVDVAFSRHIVSRLQRWGYPVRYWEQPGLAHEAPRGDELVIPWLLSHRLDTGPRRVRIRSVDLEGASAHWLVVEAFERPLEMIEVDAEVIVPGKLRIDTRNAGRIRLTLPAALRGPGERLTVIWNGEERSHRVASDQPLTLGDEPTDPRRKRRGLEGGLSRVFATPFVIVVGTRSSDPAMRAELRAKAEQLAARWRVWQHVLPRVVDDVALSDTDLTELSLVLLGDADANAVTRRLADSLPIGVTRDSVSIDGRGFAARDAVAQMLYPSPANSDRYVMVVAPTSAAGMWLWDPGQFWNPVTGQPTNHYDWTIVDGRTPSLPAGFLPERGWVASGVFDSVWRTTPELVFLGDPQARGAAPIRHKGDRGLLLERAQLDRVAGRFSLPGTPAQIELRAVDGRLFLLENDAPPIPLLARDPTHFVTEDFSTTLRFPAGAAEPCALQLINSVGETRWLKLDSTGVPCRAR